MVSNGVAAMNSLENQVEILDPAGTTLSQVRGKKSVVAERILEVIQRRLIDPT